MRILLLAPVYALVSWCMMVFLPAAPYIACLRDLYESYALYCFWVMLVLWCGGQRRVVEVLGRDDALSCFLCPLVHRYGCGLPVFRFGDSAQLFRCAICAAACCFRSQVVLFMGSFAEVKQSLGSTGFAEQ
jgi:hypothetical protein